MAKQDPTGPILHTNGKTGFHRPNSTYHKRRNKLPQAQKDHRRVVEVHAVQPLRVMVLEHVEDGTQPSEVIVGHCHACGCEADDRQQGHVSDVIFSQSHEHECRAGVGGRAGVVLAGVSLRNNAGWAS
eukprot:365240-Chlamydomonas_euryale.AAC.5